MRLLNLAGVTAGAVVGFVPAALFVLPGAARPAALMRQPSALEVASAIHAQSGRQAYCSAWPGNPGKFWCSDYGGQRCFYALFALRGGQVSVELATASPIPCKFGQYDLHATPGRAT